MERIEALRISHWIQNIPPTPDRIIPTSFEGMGTYDVDKPLFEAIRKGIYFPDFPNLDRREQSAPFTYEEVINNARSSGLVVGFSGYATGGENYDYEAELRAIETIFRTLEEDGVSRISLALHGGTREGVPVIANLVALEHGVESMGVLPTRGLDWLPEPGMDYLVVKGINWGDESETLGKSPDVLFLLGGGGNALKDAEASIANGRKLVAVRFKEYPESAAINRVDKKNFAAECSSADDLVRFLRTLRSSQH